MGDGRILTRKENVAAVSVAVDEVITRDTYTLNDTATDVLASPALFKIKDGETNAAVKVTLASGTVITTTGQDLDNANAHVIKVWDTGTDLTTSQFYLWQ